MAQKNFIEDVEESKKAGRKVFIQLGNGIYTERRYTRDNRRKKLITYASYLWNKHHPDNKIKPGENIHHKDFNAMNDNINNLQKMKISEHSQLHLDINEGRKCKIVK